MPLPLVPGGPTVSIDCRIDDGAARRGYAKVLRQEIDAARRAGLVTEVDEDWSEIETFTRLYGETMVRSGAGAEYTLGLSDVRRLRAALGGRLHLLVTRLKEAVGAVCLFTELDGIVQAHPVPRQAGGEGVEVGRLAHHEHPQLGGRVQRRPE